MQDRPPSSSRRTRGDNSAVNKSRATLVIRADLKRTADALSAIILLERKLHAASVCAAATKTVILRIWFQQRPHLIVKSSPNLNQRHPRAEFISRATLPFAQLGL